MTTPTHAHPQPATPTATTPTAAPAGIAPRGRATTEIERQRVSLLAGINRVDRAIERSKSRSTLRLSSHDSLPPLPSWRRTPGDFCAALGVRVWTHSRRALEAAIRHPRLTALGAALALPVGLALVAAVRGLGALHSLVPEAALSAEGASAIAFAIATAAVVAPLAGVIAALWLRAVRALGAQRDELVRLDGVLRRQADELRDARDQGELLAAMREVSRAVAGGDDFDSVLRDVLRILDDFANPCAAAIFLDDGTGRLIPRFTTGEADAIDQDIRVRAHEASRRHQVMREVCRKTNRHLLTVPFEADGDAPGVLWVARSLEGIDGPLVATDGVELDVVRLADERRSMDEFERRIVYFIKHVALAVRHLTLYDRATVDGLTRLYNRSHFERHLRHHCGLARRDQGQVSLILIDIDHFKQVNDVHGHLAGDHVLAGVALLIKQTVRETDLAFRYGGEEMVVICPGTDADEAASTAERVRVAIESAVLRGDDGQHIPTAVSLGVAAYEPNEPDSALIARADAALYHSKDGGRNMTTVAPPLERAVPELLASDSHDQNDAHAAA